MGVSDCIISKAGGLTVSESLASGLPMIIVRPIPGQETRNCRILVRYGLAVRARSTGDIKRYVTGFMDDPERIKNIRLRMSFLSTADSSREIAEFIHSQAGAGGRGGKIDNQA
jgi:processive 1,2-diacylglycerol beta-glucosyltransferase